MSIFFPNSIELSLADRMHIHASSEESSKYKPSQSRYNPFLDEHIIQTIQNNIYSPFLNKNISNAEEAAWHAKYLTESWAKEDEAEKLERRRLQNIEKQRTFRLNKKQEISPEVKEAQEKWKAAIVQRNYLSLKIATSKLLAEPDLNVGTGIMELNENES